MKKKPLGLTSSMHFFSRSVASSRVRSTTKKQNTVCGASCRVKGYTVAFRINIKSLSCKNNKKKVIYHHEEKVIYHHALSSSPDLRANKLYNLCCDSIILFISPSHRSYEKRKHHKRRLAALTWSVVSVKNGKREEGSVAVGSEGGLGQGGQVVHVVETRAVCVIIARQQQVHVVWSLETEGGRGAAAEN